MILMSREDCLTKNDRFDRWLTANGYLFRRYSYTSMDGYYKDPRGLMYTVTHTSWRKFLRLFRYWVWIDSEPQSYSRVITDNEHLAEVSAAVQSLKSIFGRSDVLLIIE